MDADSPAPTRAEPPNLDSEDSVLPSGAVNGSSSAASSPSASSPGTGSVHAGAPSGRAAAAWVPLSPTQRRVVGVLVEKAKTTPEQYPLTLNALTTGCNQKNNRHPLTNLTQDQVEQAIDELRQLGAVVEVQGGGRVPKYKHCLYEWLGVDKAELAVMAELLLRGDQTVGELRTRAARMESIADLTALRPILQSLKNKSLLRELTPEGRGQVVSHNLYKDRELANLQARVVGMVEASADRGDEAVAGSSGEPSRSVAVPARDLVTRDLFNELQVEVAELRAEVARLRAELQRVVG